MDQKNETFFQLMFNCTRLRRMSTEQQMNDTRTIGQMIDEIHTCFTTVEQQMSQISKYATEFQQQKKTIQMQAEEIAALKCEIEQQKAKKINAVDVLGKAVKLCDVLTKEIEDLTTAKDDSVKEQFTEEELSYYK